MADWQKWLDRGKQWLSAPANDVQQASDEAAGTGTALAEKMKMVNSVRDSMPQQPAAQAPAPAPMAATPYRGDAVNPGYQPLGGENALQSLYAGQPPALLPPPAARRKFAHGTPR